MSVRTSETSAPVAGSRLSFPVLTLDQAVYSASNFAIAALAGRSLAADDFGRLAAVLLIVAVAIGLVRAIVHEPDIGTGRPLRPGRIPLGVGAALAATTAVVAGPLVIGAGAALLAALVQDRARYRAVAAARPVELLTADLLWLAVVAIGLVGWVATDSPVAVLRLWTVGAAVGTLPLLTDRMGRPATGEAEEAEPRPGSARRATAALDAALFTGMTQLGGLLLAALLPLPEFGALRGAIIAFGPVGILTAGLGTWIFAAPTGDGQQTDPPTTKIAAVAGLALVALVAALVLPRSVGIALLGSGWPPRSVLAPIGLTVVAQTISTPGLLLLRRRNERRRLLRLRAWAVVAFLVVTTTVAETTASATAVAVGYLVVNAGLAAAVIATMVGRTDSTPGDPDPMEHDGSDEQTGRR